jgi:hypothetical protein
VLAHWLVHGRWYVRCDLKVDNIDTYSPLQIFNGNRFYFGNPEPPEGDRVDGFTWFEPNAIFPQPWTWNATESVWLSAPFVYDWGYTTFTHTSLGANSWSNRVVPFYNETGNRIFVKDIFGIYFNTGSIVHDATQFQTITLERFTGQDQLFSIATLNQDSKGLAVPTYATSNGIANKPSAASSKRLTMRNVNVWMTGNTWYQRMRLVRGGTTTTGSLSIGISLTQILQFARL